MKANVRKVSFTYNLAATYLLTRQRRKTSFVFKKKLIFLRYFGNYMYLSLETQEKSVGANKRPERPPCISSDIRSAPKFPRKVTSKY